MAQNAAVFQIDARVDKEEGGFEDVPCEDCDDPMPTVRYFERRKNRWLYCHERCLRNRQRFHEAHGRPKLLRDEVERLMELLITGPRTFTDQQRTYIRAAQPELNAAFRQARRRYRMALAERARKEPA